ncbi:MAG: TonB-dependent receptor [Proteobacteria bacterium]|nr:TonB-dependent receptor [Pseudomonadota bacterium]
MIFVKRILLVFIALFLVPEFLSHLNRAIASDESPVTMAPVIVSAKKAEENFQTGDVDPEQTTAFSATITHDEFDGKMETLANVIEKEAGIQVTQTGGFGSYSSVSLRGSSSEQVMVYLDGILLNEASGGGVDLSNISLSDVESVEIYKGMAPINFNRSSIGGVVNIKTLRAGKEMQKSITAGYGSFNTVKLAGLISHKPGPFDYLVSADYSGSDNDFDYLNPNNTREVPEDDYWQKRNHAAVNQHNILAKLGYDFSSDSRIDLMNQWFEKDQDLPDRSNTKDSNIRLDTKRNISSISLIKNNLTDFQLNTRTGFEYSWKEEAYSDEFGNASHAPIDVIYLNRRYSGDFFLESITAYGILNARIEVSREEFDADNKNTSESTDINQSHRNSFVTALQYSLMLLDDRVMITPAVNYTVFDDHRESGTEAIGLPETSHVKKEYVTPQIGFKYAVNTWLTLKTNAARYIREPSFFELFGDRGYFKGDIDIDAEKGTNFDIGADIHQSFGKRLILNDFRLSTAFFSSKVDDLIVMVYDSGGNAQPKNIATSTVHGIESAINIQLLNHFYLTANTTLQDTNNESNQSAHNGKELPGRFKKSFLGKIEFRYNGLKLFSEYILQQDMYYDIPNLPAGKAEDKKELNAGVSILFNDLLVTLEGKNLFDDIYEEFYKYPLPGRSFSVTAKYTF